RVSKPIVVPAKAGTQSSGRSALAARRLLAAIARLGLRRVTQRVPVRDQVRAFDFVVGDIHPYAIDLHADPVAVHRRDLPAQAPASIARQLQRDLGLLAEETRELRSVEQRPLDPGR